MLRIITWCAKCLFLYLIVAIGSIRFSWIVTRPVWQIALRMHWTQMKGPVYILSYFLPIFAATGFLVGLIPFGKLTKALGELFVSMFPGASKRLNGEPDEVAPILWAWLPVTVAFLIRFATWRSRNFSVLDPQRSPGRVERFFGRLPSQTPALFDSRWISDRFLFTGPMLFLMACALAVLLRHRLMADGKAAFDPAEL